MDSTQRLTIRSDKPLSLIDRYPHDDLPGGSLNGPLTGSAGQINGTTRLATILTESESELEFSQIEFGLHVTF